MKKIKNLLILALVLVMVLTSCTGNTKAPSGGNETQTEGQGNGQDEPANKDGAQPQKTAQDVEVLNVGCIYEFETANFSSNLMQMLTFENFCFSNPVRINSDLEVVPSFAESYETAEDNMSITFTIPTDAKWHDGQPVTAEDFKFSVDYCMNVLNTMRTYFESCEIIDDHTVKVNLLTTSPVVTLRHWTMWNRTCLLPKHIWENVDDPKAFEGEGSMVGCGPYKFDSYDADARIVYFDAYEDYHLGVPSVKRIAFKLYENKESIIMALKNNEIDCFYQYASGLPGQYADAVNSLAGYDAGLVYNMGVPMLVFNMGEKATANLEVRTAISYALDYEQLAATLGQGYAEVAGKGVTNPINIGYDESIPKNVQDVDKAKEMLDKAGYVDIDGDGFRETPEGQPYEQMVTSQQSASLGTLYDRLAQIVVRDLNNVGIKSYLDEEVIGSADKYKDRIQNEDFDIYLVSTTGGANFIDTAFKYLSTERTGYYGGTLSDPDFFELYFGLLDSVSVEEYTDYRTKLQHYAADNVPCIALGWDQMFYPYNTDRFEGWIVREGHGPFTYETWFNLQELK